MATPPTFVSSTASTWADATSPETFSQTVGVGDYLAVMASADDAMVWSTPTGGSLTYTSQQQINTGGSAVGIWTAPSSSSQTYTQSLAKSSGAGSWWGYMDVRFTGSDGIGASAGSGNHSSGTPSLSITTTAANSALVCIIADFAGGSTSGRTWLTVNGITPTAGNGLELVATSNAHWTIYAAYWSDAGAIGSKTVGMSAPSMFWSIAAVEIKSLSSSFTAPPPLIAGQLPALIRASLF